MSASSFRFGYSVGTAVREIFRATRTAERPALPVKANIVSPFPMQSSISSAAELEEMCLLPAIVRLDKVNLTDWFNQNVRECQPAPQSTAKKRKPRKASALKQVDSSSLGSLNELIA
ncbi:hypothetical protein M2401_006813 [Pseudomonas sp. JUb42]|uniref:hypothetical protein n=1 Tax=Pseudomonas sp. JUb42 TaxID=2940611 RepID=UPI002169A6E6|nr:hypothetical protein [Pseudomonas sp. JUb42]MCS3473045.1 hypothetical protein [Pseudomonas sp. JUb42]